LFFAQAGPNSAYWSINAFWAIRRTKKRWRSIQKKTKDNDKTVLPKPANLRHIGDGADGRVLPTKICLLLKGDLDITPSLQTNPG
jgi:hypothetical protein